MYQWSDDDDDDHHHMMEQAQGLLRSEGNSEKLCGLVYGYNWIYPLH